MLATLCFYAFVVLAAIGSTCGYVQAQAVEARVVKVTGRATISRSARPAAALRQGEVLAPSDVIDTSGGGSVRIELTDGSVVIVQPGTRVILQDYGAAGSLRELLKIVVGRVRIKINHFGGQPNPYRVNSPSASIGVRGTEFSVSVGTAGDTEVVVYEGSVEVTSLSDPKDRVTVEPGRGVIVRPNEPIRFFTPGPDNEIGERDRPDERKNNSGPTNNARNESDSDNQRTAAGVYERYVDSIVDSGETPLPSRFTAFPDSHLDSLENPSYATEFKTTEGRIFLLPSFGGTRDNEEARAAFGFGDPRPVDYSLSPQMSFFKPFAKQRAVVGGSLAFSSNGIQTFSLDENVALSGAPFLPGTIGSRATVGSTTNSFFTGSLIAARRFGADGRTSLGVSVDFLSQHGSLLNLTTRDNSGGLTQRERIESHANVQRTRFTIGLSRDIGAASKLGIFYRYGYTSANDRNRLRTVNGVPFPLELTTATGNSSELGVRLRGPLTRRLFYGAEGTLLFGRSNENLRNVIAVDSNEGSRATRATLGFGLGYAFRPRTVFSFDVTGGISRSRSFRREDATGNLLENERQTARFLSLHAAVQADVWRQMFASASVLSLTQSRLTDLSLFPDRFGRRLTTDGIFVPDGPTRDRFTDYFATFGLGWRFNRNFLAEYVLSTDFGQTAPRHTLLLRYTFNLGGK